LSDDGLGNDAETIPKYKHYAWNAVLAQHGTEDIELRDSIIERHRTERTSRLRSYLGVEELLMQVSPKYPLELVTNGSPAVQRFKLERAGLSGFFSAVVTSGDVAFGKPDPKPFLSALESLGVDPDSAVMIGNSWRSDVQGANNLGIASFGFNQQSLPSGEGSPPPIEVSSLRQIPEALMTLGSR